jgi:hypothetical protein
MAEPKLAFIKEIRSLDVAIAELNNLSSSRVTPLHYYYYYYYSIFPCVLLLTFCAILNNEIDFGYAAIWILKYLSLILSNNQNLGKLWLILGF